MTPTERVDEHVRSCEVCQRPGTMCIDQLVLLDELYPEPADPSWIPEDLS